MAMVPKQSLHFYYGGEGVIKKNRFSGVSYDCRELDVNIRQVPRSKHSPSRILTRHAMDYNVIVRRVRVTIIAAKTR